MCKGKPWMSTLIMMVFLAGIIAPLPECYVYRVACPVKTSFAAQESSGKGSACPASAASCCSKATPSAEIQKKCNLTGFKPRMKSYLPDIESVSVPAVLLALLPSLFHAPYSPRNIVVPYCIISFSYAPDPIPILLRKQSFLI